MLLAGGGAGGGPRGRARSDRSGAGRQRGALPRDLRGVAVRDLPGGPARRVPVRQRRRPADHRALGGRRAGARLDERAAPGGSRADRFPLGADGRDERAGYTTPMHRFVHANGDGRLRRGSGGAADRHARRSQLPGHPRGRDRRGSPPRRSGASCSRAPRRRASRPRPRARRRRARGPRSPASSSRISDAFVALDLEGRYTYANDRAIAMMGLTAREAPGPDRLVALPAHPGERRFSEAFEQAVREQRPGRRRGARHHDDRWFDVRVYPSATGVSVFFEDVSDPQAPRGGADRRSRLPAPGAGRARRGVRGGRARSRPARG